MFTVVYYVDLANRGRVVNIGPTPSGYVTPAAAAGGFQNRDATFWRGAEGGR